MKKKIALLLLAAALVAPGCKKKNTVIDREILDPVDITFTETEKQLYIGETYQINPYYGTAEEQLSGTFNYRSLNESVATVSSNGLVNAVGKGTCVIEVTCNKSKSLFKIVVLEQAGKSVLNFQVNNKEITLYIDDTYEVSYVASLDAQPVTPTISFSSYDSEIIDIENKKILAKKQGNSSLVITATYHEYVASEVINVEVIKASYILASNLVNKQAVVGEEDVELSYSLFYKGNEITTYTASELNLSVSDEETATIVNHKLHALKKGNISLTASVYSTEAEETVYSTESIRIREKYHVTHLETGVVYDVLDGDRLLERPVNSDPALTFDCWLLNGVAFDGLVNSDLSLDAQWSLNEFNFAANTQGAYVYAPEEPAESNKTNAVAYKGDGEYDNGLKYPLIKNVHGDGGETEAVAGHIYLPKLDYRKTTTVTYLWESDGWVSAEGDHWYGGGDPIGGTIVITNDGHTISETITQTFDVVNPFTPEISYKDKTSTRSIVDNDVLTGNKCLESIKYWSFDSVAATKNIFLSNPKVTFAEEYIPNFSLGIHGATFSTTDANAHYNAPYLEPSVKCEENEGTAYLYYFQDRAWDATEWPHCRANYTLGLPRINFGKYNKPLSIPFETESGIYVGFAEDKVVGSDSVSVHGYFEFERINDNSVIFSIKNSGRSTLYSATITDSNIINGTSSYIFPVCYSTFCYQRGLKIYQPELLAEHEHNYIDDPNCIGKKVCPLCGDSTDYATPLSEIDFTTSVYGAHGGKFGAQPQSAKVIKHEITNVDVEEQVYLPKINYKAYARVTFNISGSADWDIQVGIISGSYAFPYVYKSGVYSGNLTFVINGNELNVTFACAEGTTQTITITDQNIINGTESASLYMLANDNLYRGILVELTGLVDGSGPCVHNYVTDTTCIGRKICSYCDEVTNYATPLSEIDFTVNKYNAHGGRFGAQPQSALVLKHEITEGHTEEEVFLPRINFKAFSQVTFVVSGSADWDTRVGIISDSYAFPYVYKSGVYSGTLTFVTNGNDLNVTFACAEGTTQNITISDADIINGLESASIFMITDNAYRGVLVELTGLVA